MQTLRWMGLMAFLLVSLAPVTFAQERFTADRMMEVKRIGSQVVSPDGQHLLYTVSTVDPAANRTTTHIWKRELASGEERDLGPGGGPQWRPDGQRVGFMRGGQLWEMAPDGSNPVQVTQIEGGISNVMYAPDGRHLAFTRRVQIEETAASRHPDLPNANARFYNDLMYRHWDTFHEGKFSHLHIVRYENGQVVGEPLNVMAGEPFHTPLPPFGGASHLAWRPDGQAIVYTSKKLNGVEAAYSTNSDLYLYDLASGETTNLTSDNPGYDFYPAFSPDGRQLAWLQMVTPRYEADRYRLMLMDMATGERRELTEGFDQNANSHIWSPDGRRIHFLSGIEATVQIYTYEMEAGRTPALRQVTFGTHDYTGIAVIPGSQDVIASRMSMSAPVDLYRVNTSMARMEPVQLTQHNRELLENTAMGRVEQRWVPTTDGQRMLVWVIYPPDFDPNRTYPALLYAQGGPQGTVSQFFSYRWNFQVMAANGYIVVAPNRRGLPSFGEAWNRQISGDWGGQAMQDLLSAIDNVAAEPYVDNARLGAVGASFGGYSVFWLAGNHENRFKTFISHAGVFHLESMYGETEEMFFVDFDLDGNYWSTPRPVSYDQHSPHLYADRWNTPIMMIHGELDYRVPVGQSYQAFTLARAKGIPSRMLLFPNENHWILQPQNSLLWHREFYQWLGEWLSPGQ